MFFKGVFIFKNFITEVALNFTALAQMVPETKRLLKGASAVRANQLLGNKKSLSVSQQMTSTFIYLNKG